MNVEFTAQALDDLAWFVQRDPRTARRIVKLIEDVRRAPFDGIGKPEPLKGDLSGWWSRRIDGEHRLVYRVVEAGGVARVQVAQCRYHY
ncbi:MAG: Txe/YoeB family addiction module toxin [Oceanicaulis sp.]